MSRHRLKILIVDDHVEFCEVLCEILTEEGYDSHCVENGQEALDRLKASKPGLILLDWQMPVTWEALNSCFADKPAQRLL